MRSVLAIGFSALSFLGLAAGIQVQQQFQADASQQFKAEDGSVYKFEGVCTFDERHIDCKTPTGAEDPTVAHRLEDYYRQQQLGGYFMAPLSVVFGRQTRLVVFSGVGPNPSMTLSVSGAGVLQTNQSAGLPGDPTIAWLVVTADLHTNAVDITVAPNVPRALPPGRIEFREGAKTTYEGVVIRLGGAKPAPPYKFVSKKGFQQCYDPNNVFQAEPGPHWLYLLQTDSSATQLTNLSYTVLDKSGDPIVYVDRKGNAVSAMTVVKESPVPPAGYEPQPPQPGYGWGSQVPQIDPRQKPIYKRPLAKYRPLEFYLGRFSDGAVSEIFSNLNPTQVGALEITGSRPYTVLFKSVPLDSGSND